MESPWGTVDPGEQPPPRAGAWFPSSPPESPPVAGEPGPPPGQAVPKPVGAPPAGGGAGPVHGAVAGGPVPEPTPSPSRPAGRGAGGAAVAAGAVGVLIALVVGFTAGRISSHTTPSAVFGRAARSATGQTTVTLPAPLKGNEAEPVEAVAKVLSPAVVQLQTDNDLGSGFVYDSSGLIMTAAHVVQGQSTMQVRMADGTQTQGKVLGADSSTDVAVVKIDPPANMPVATLATNVQPQVGQMAIAIGSPYGLDQTVTAGIISAVGRAVQTPSGEVAMLQTDAPINPGNSGGALADRLGRVIGINDSIISGSSSSQDAGNVGVGFAIPIDLAKSVADRIVTGRSLAAGYLGVRGNDATGSRAGALVVSVEAGGPADKAGVKEGDVVVAFDSTRIQGMTDLAAAVRTHQPGEQVSMTILRNGKQLQLTVTLGKAGS